MRPGLHWLDPAMVVTTDWHPQEINTLFPNGKRKPAVAVMFVLLAEIPRAERESLSERIKSGLKEAKRKEGGWGGLRVPRTPTTSF